ncbi:hypothetical protein E3N88_07364 [Mikania micrantha]|uniref:Uncharacterized protein n=1 Tax=Mikania micrantha TaxID=192012 RepID=A0A5N6PRE6_9ASTR|nr:hypothetical protein E3N88_07364 [Mikania micrantha]
MTYVHTTSHRGFAEEFSNNTHQSHLPLVDAAGCGAHENSTVKRAQAAAIQGWVTSLGSFHLGNRMQNRELLVGKADNIGGRRDRMLQNGIRDTPVLHGIVGKTSSRTMSP